MVFRAEQAYNPLTQEFRDGQCEAQQQVYEGRMRMEHLNRARDIQMRREQQHNVVNHEDRLAPLFQPDHKHKQFEPVPLDDQVNNPSIPKTYVDYNIVSNLPFEEHHWDHPAHRPIPRQRNPKQRLIPAVEVKDFNILSNRYTSNHEDKTFRDQALNSFEATDKFRRRNRFDPVLQRMTDACAEANLQVAEHAAMTEKVLHTEASMPMCYRGRVTASYNPVSHEVHDSEMLSRLEAAEEARISRYFTKHTVDRNTKLLELMAEDAATEQRFGQVAHQRFEEVASRGYDILTNRAFGIGPKHQKLHPPYTKPEASIWEKAKAKREEFPSIGDTTLLGQELHVTCKVDASPASACSCLGGKSAGGATASTTAAAVVAASIEATDASNLHLTLGPGSSTTPRVKQSSGAALSIARSDVSSARTPKPLRMAAVQHSAASQAVAAPPKQHLRAPPAPEVPGTPVGSVYSRRQP